MLWHLFEFIVKDRDIDEIYIDGYYCDEDRLTQTPIWDKLQNMKTYAFYHSCQYTITNETYQYYLSRIKVTT